MTTLAIVFAVVAAALAGFAIGAATTVRFIARNWKAIRQRVEESD